MKYSYKEIDDSCYKGEVRDGFYIRPMVKRAWAVELDILKVIADICEKNGIKWCATFGTLLGAVRHKGFIPWDDDIDISMKRADYERFIKVAPSELPPGWRLFNGAQDLNPTNGVLRVINSETVCVEEQFLMKYHGCPYIMGVDIYPLDNLPNSREERELYWNLVFCTRDCYAIVPDTALIDECDEDLRIQIHQLTDKLGVHLKRYLPVKSQLIQLADRLSAMYFDVDTEALTCTSGLGKRVVFSLSSYSDTIMFPFETLVVPVPIGYDSILREWYGNEYMIPKNTGSSHDYPVFSKAENLLKQYYKQNHQEFPEEFM